MSQEFIKRILSSIILIPITFFLIIKGSFFFNIFILICFFITSFEWYMMSKKKFYNIFGIIFLIISFYSIYKLRNQFGAEYLYLLFVTIICVSTDLGGYIFGNLFKGPKLTKISPKKTYSGMIGGYLMSVILIYYFLKNTSFSGSIDLSSGVFIFVLLISTISQLGDILISYFKRLSKIKDTGKIIPGHGGLLDRVDGMIFAFPFSYFIFSIDLFGYF
jgi:phosphatidate cytidylyltransferase